MVKRWKTTARKGTRDWNYTRMETASDPASNQERPLNFDWISNPGTPRKPEPWRREGRWLATSKCPWSEFSATVTRVRSIDDVRMTFGGWRSIEGDCRRYRTSRSKVRPRYRPTWPVHRWQRPGFQNSSLKNVENDRHLMAAAGNGQVCPSTPVKASAGNRNGSLSAIRLPRNEMIIGFSSP